MAYQTNLNEYLYNIHCELWDLNGLIPAEFIIRAQCIVNTGSQNHVIGMIGQAIRHYRYERAIIKYIHIIDKLLKLPSYRLAIQTVIVDLFYQIFISFWNQKCFNEIQELKILRKFWVGILHPFVLKKMRDVIITTTNIDIDHGFKLQAVLSIKAYYQNRLRMTPQQIAQFLPILYDEKEKIRKKTDELTRSPTTELPEQIQTIGNYPKRQRLISQSFSKDTEIEQKPRKRINVNKDNNQLKNNQRNNYEIILEKLKSNSKYSCEICGKMFMLRDIYDQHLHSHYLQNRQKMESKSKKFKVISQRYFNCSQYSWIQSQQPILSLNRFCVPFHQQSQPSSCPLCGSNLTQNFIQQTWVYSNAVKVELQGQIKIAHRTCFQEMKESSN